MGVSVSQARPIKFFDWLTGNENSSPASSGSPPPKNVRITVSQLTQIDKEVLRQSWAALGHDGQITMLRNAFTNIMGKSKHIKASFGAQCPPEALKDDPVVHAHANRFQKFVNDLLECLADDHSKDKVAVRLLRRTGAAHLRLGKLAWEQESLQLFIVSLCTSLVKQSRIHSKEDGEVIYQTWEKTFQAVVAEMREALYRAEIRHPSTGLINKQSSLHINRP